jgi:hypothetical protein
MNIIDKFRKLFYMEERIEVTICKFVQYCKEGDFYNIEQTLKKYPELVDFADAVFFNIVVRNGHLNIIKLFTNIYANNGNEVEKLIRRDHSHALCVCVNKNYIDCAEFFFENGARPMDIINTNEYNKACEMYNDWVTH